MKSSHWDNVWNKKIDTPLWDYLSQVILGVLKKEIVELRTLRILEAGSGSGRISSRISEVGAKVYLLDNSMEAINLSRQVFAAYHKTPEVVCADIFRIPFPDNYFDLVWNAGVVEHFVGAEQDMALKEMARVCKKKGIIVTINPYAGSVLHTFGKLVIEKLAKYPFGEEIPIRTLADKADILKCKLKKKEYSTGFIVLWVGMFKRLALLPGRNLFNVILTLLNRIFCAIDNSFFGPVLRRIDLMLSRIFGGYLIVSIFEKE